MQIPGAPKRLLFTSTAWNQAYGIVRAPLGAELMKVTYSFNVRNTPGKTDGLIFFDDGFVEQLPADFPVQAMSDIAAEPDDDDGSAVTTEPAPTDASRAKAPEAPAK